MIHEFETITQGINSLMETWEGKLLKLPDEVFTERRNNQNRTIKQIVGYLIDELINGR